MEQYHVLGIDLGYRTGNYEEENLIQRLHYYNSGSTDHQIKGIQYLTDQSGQAFREQVLAYMEQRYGMDLVKSLPEQQKNGNRQRQKNLIWKRKQMK